MGLFDKIKKSLFNEEEDKLVQDDRNLRSLNPNYNRSNVTFTEPTPTQTGFNNPTPTPKPTPAPTYTGEEFKTNKNVNIIKNFYPTEYRETEDIAKAIIEGYTVEIDLSNMHNESIIRTLDFLSGLTYGRGKVTRRSKYEFTFVINE